MKKFIITISREFGCNAREVARKAAAELGVEFYDKDLVDMAAERAGISRDSFLDSEEMLDKNADRLLKSFGYGSSTQFYSDKAVKAQVEYHQRSCKQACIRHILRQMCRLCSQRISKPHERFSLCAFGSKDKAYV